MGALTSNYMGGRGVMHPLTVSEHARLVYSALEKPDAITNDVSPEVANSWRRCLIDYRLDPVRRAEPAVVERTDLRQRQEQLAPLLEFAKSEMTSLYQQVAGSGYAILLTDMDGVILNYVGDPQFTDAAMRSGLHNGSVWSEAAQGTNGMGTCIAMKKPLVVHQHEHFLSRHTGLTCSAAPIRDPSGEMMAVLDASSESRLAQQHTMVLVNMAAQTIENRMFLAAFKEHFLIRFHSRPEFVSTLGEGAIALDETGTIRGANCSALFQLGIRLDNLIGCPVEKVFDGSMTTLINSARKHSYHPMAIRSACDGRRFHVVIQLPIDIPCKTDSRGLRRNPIRSVRVPSSECRLQLLDLGDPTMARNIDRARRLLNRNIPLLLYGETGTGKGIFAKALHDESERSSKPFVAVNCAAIPEALIESELFGYRPGAFTGANRNGSRGKILQADGGTLFLDEIGDMSLHLQARLLRVLEEKEVVPLGGESPEKVNLAIISATHRDLTTLISDGRFREDLYYRLHGMALTMPPLRERHDRRALMHAIAQNEAGNEGIELSEEALDILDSQAWPGNIRQLRNTLRTVLAFCDGGVIKAEDLPDDLCRVPLGRTSTGNSTESQGQSLDPLAEAECRALLKELNNTRWNVAQLARNLDVSRNTLYRKMRRYGIRPPR